MINILFTLFTWLA